MDVLRLTGLRAHDVVGDAEHVESGLAIGVDQLADRLRAVAPGRMSVQLTQQGGISEACHEPDLLRRAAGTWGPTGHQLETIR